jgi:acetylornithine deacetylase/succinyl-diaminopimelate desuccinylase-like protein
MNTSRLLLLLICVSVLIPSYANSNDGGTLQADVRDWREVNEQSIVDGFVELLSIPNVAADTVNIQRNADYLVRLFDSRGFSTRLLTSDGPPAVFAEKKTPGADRTVLIYIHYDGQPANAADWASDPWVPVMRTGLVEDGGEEVPISAPFDPEWRLFGRSTGDDKAPVIALLAAIDALESLDQSPGVNLKVFLEGEEEAGSPHLQEVLAENRDLLQADLWLFCDGPMHQSRRLQLVYGVRGTFGVDVTVYGASRPLHSGHYGNWAPNPIVELMALLRSMRDEAGNILVAGYSDEVTPPSEAELAAIRSAPLVDDLLLEQLAIGAPETNERVEMAIMRPAINLRGIRSGDVGDEARNAIQVSATASVGLRLVPKQTPNHVRQAIEAHIREQGYHIVYAAPDADERREHAKIVELNWPDHGYPAYRASMELPIALEIAEILDGLNENPLIQLPTMGGSLPIYLIAEEIGAPVLILPVANHDNNQHGKDENIRLQNLWDAIEIYAAVLTGL